MLSQNLSAGILVAGFMAFGSLNTLSTKLQFSLSSVGLDGAVHEFKKPFFGSYRMFLAMTLVLYSYMGARLYAWCFIGLLHISASVWQMLRGSMVVFSGILSVLFLKRRLRAYNWAGIGLCVVGILMVGSASMLSSGAAQAQAQTQPLEQAEGQAAGGEESADDAAAQMVQSRLFGMGIVLVGQFISACQVVTEEFILKDAADLPPAVVVGIEGLWGFLLLSLVGLPLLYALPGTDFGGCQENLMDTFVMIGNSSALVWLTALYLVTCSCYNFCGMSITRVLSAVERTMLDAWRTMVVWLTGVAYYYAVDPRSDFGEPWTVWSYLQLAGFGSLIFGQLLYGGLVRFPAVFNYDDILLQDAEITSFEEYYKSPAATMNLLISPHSQLSTGSATVTSPQLTAKLLTKTNSRGADVEQGGASTCCSGKACSGGGK
eukprot:g11225.t1